MTGFYENTITALVISCTAFINYGAIARFYTCEGKNDGQQVAKRKGEII